MVLLLARCWNYKLKTEDVLELTRGNRRIALCTVVGLLEDGETYSTELKQRQRPGEGQMGQWEHELVVERYEKPLLMQICRLLRGFTHPGTYFEAGETELALYSVEKFAEEMSSLLLIALKSRLMEKLSSALFECLFGINRLFKNDKRSSSDREETTSGKADLALEESDHVAVVSVNAFIQNLYFYASENNEMFRLYILEETLFIPRMLLPYLEQCIHHVIALSSESPSHGGSSSRSGGSKEEDEEEEGSGFGWWTHFPQLVSGISSTLRTLIIATFRASHINLLSSTLLNLNPTPALLQAAAFCAHHEYIFSLLCILNINAGAVDISVASTPTASRHSFSNKGASIIPPAELLDNLARVYKTMPSSARARVHRRVATSGALPVSRDTPSYLAMMSVLNDGEAGQLQYLRDKGMRDDGGLPEEGTESTLLLTRAEAKAEQQQRLSSFSESVAPSPSLLPSANMEVDIAESKREEAASNLVLAKDTAPVTSKQRSEYKISATSLLGDLPSLSVPKPAVYNNGSGKGSNTFQGKNKGKKADSTLPKEFLCAINGHVMKEPVRVRGSQLVFEKSTIELWLSTQGAVCPITNAALERTDLQPDEDLRNRIMRYHIQQTSMRVAESSNEDLYDF